MTNTKFRKRALLSSVAMLLVALVALGSATFAWYTTSPTANATGLTLKTTAGAGLEIKTATDNARGWLKTAYLNFDKTAYDADNTVLRSVTTAFDIQPASYVGSNTFLTVAADDAYNSVADDSATVDDATIITNSTPNSTLGAGVYKEQIDLRVTGGNAAVISLSSVSLSEHTNAIDTKSGVRVLVTKTDGTVIGNYALANSGTDTVFLAAHDGEKYEDVKDALSTLPINNKSTAVALGDATTSMSVYVYVFLNGFDSNVKSSIVDGSTLIDSITLNFSIPG